MNTAKTSNIIEKKDNFNRVFISLFRIVLGILLFIKGIIFIRNEGILRQVFSETESIQRFSLLQTGIPFIHILGGFLILIGLYTRIAIMVQLPFVIGALFVLLSAKKNAFNDSEIVFATVILVMLIIILKFGEGFYSWKNLIEKEKDIL
jgi:uncharacterized membrane protein YphA (DoxX/SURF4 family)